MATTTLSAIRTLMRQTVVGLTPQTQAHVTFTTWDEVGPSFRRWAEESAPAALRRFTIVDSGNVSVPNATNIDREWVETDVDVVVAYPRDHRYGSSGNLDVHDTIELDLKQIKHAIGPEGYAALDTVTTGDACVVQAQQLREDGDAVMFGILKMRVGYWRAME